MLVREGRQVGYRKQVGGLEMFSRDGYAFTGAPIPFDRALPETPMRTVDGRRVYEGDVVELRPAPDADFEQRLVLSEAGRVLVAPPRASQLEDLEAGWGHLRGVPIRRRVGSIHAVPYLAGLFEPALGALQQKHHRHWPTALRMAGAIGAGGVASGILQLYGLGAVGPLGVCVGAGLTAVAAALAEMRAFGQVLTPAFLSRVGPRAAAVNALTAGGIYLMTSFAGYLDVDAQARWLGTMAAAALGGLLTLALVVTLGNAVDHFSARD